MSCDVHFKLSPAEREREIKQIERTFNRESDTKSGEKMKVCGEKR